MDRRFLLDNDGCNFVRNLGRDWEADVRETVAECAPNVTTYLICAGAGTYYFPTEVGIVDPLAKRLLELHAEGKDPFGMLIDRLRAAGKETFITFRMNDVHNPDAEDQWNTPRIRREHPEYVVDYEGVRAGKGDWMAWCLDYARPEVQDYILSIMGELASRYRFDGLQLDWMRFPRHLSGRTPEEVWEKREALTEFTVRAREIVRKAGAKLAARIPTSPAGCRRLGVDVAEWTRRELLDFLVASPFLTTDYQMPLGQIGALMGGHHAPLYAGLDFNHATQNHCPESLRATCSSLYACGADGIYLFNFPCWNEYLAARPFHWLDGLDDPGHAARKPLLFSVSHRTHRIGHVDLAGVLPVTIPAGGRREFVLVLPEPVLPAARARVLLHAGGATAVAVNGRPCEELPSRRRELFLEYVDHAWQKDNLPKNVEARTFRADPGALRAGENAISIENLATADSDVHRVNLGLW